MHGYEVNASFPLAQAGILIPSQRFKIQRAAWTAPFIASVGYKIFLFSAFLLTIFSWSVKKGEVQRKFSLHWLYKNVDITNVIVLHVSWLRNEWGNRKKIIHNRTFGLSSWNNIVLEGELTGARITLLIIQYLNLTSKCVQLFHDGSRLST